MKIDAQVIALKIYPVFFALVFLGISIIPILKPEVTLSTIGKKFWGYDKLIEVFTSFRLAIGDRVFPPSVLVGKDGRFFYTALSSMNEYQKVNLFSGKDLAEYQNKLDRIDRELKKRNAMFLVIIPPNAATIYPQYMPDEIAIVGKQSRTDQFIDYMRQHGQIQIIDLRPALIEASKTQDVYFKTDPHWNYRAWYIAYAKVLSVVSERYPKVEAKAYTDYDVVLANKITLQLANVMGLPDKKEEFWVLKPKFPVEVKTSSVPFQDVSGRVVRFSTSPNPGLPSALIFHDSFFQNIVPLLEPNFRQTTSVFRNAIPSVWNMNWIDQVHPDVVILEFTEFYLNAMDESIPAFH